ncbi:hypothetical protein GCM10007426_05670 [Alloalcanivorax dieselolei]|nr:MULTISPECIES: hypothetical protein [Alcanivoracaceae]KAF0808506.1 hypothetical protein A6D6_00215 [Alcanivorax xiamenensis]GGJ79378.1 hypothetical protein GCM10007426_05670 [Alloalcanivorax dieselolei]
MMRTRLMNAVWAMGLLSLMGGCQSPGMSKKELSQRLEEPGFNTVVFADYDLNRNFSEGLFGPDKVLRLSSAGHGIGHTDTGTSEVWLELRNHTDHNYVVEARTRFFSQQGIPVDAKPVWQRLPVPANSSAVYREKSVGTERLQYRIEVRQAR